MDQTEIESIAAVAVREYLRETEGTRTKQEIALAVVKKTNISGASARIAIEAIDFYVDISES